MDLSGHGVVAVIVREGKILMLEDAREQTLGWWGPVHGRCELEDEIEENSVIRETMEEVGLVARPIRKLWTAEADTKVKMISFWLTEVEDGEIVLDERESAQYGWFSVDEALELKLYPATVVFLEKVRDGEISLE